MRDYVLASYNEDLAFGQNNAFAVGRRERERERERGGEGEGGREGLLIYACPYTFSNVFFIFYYFLLF